MNILTLGKSLLLTLSLSLAGLAQASAPALPAAPQLAAKSYVLMDAASGKVLVENNGDQRLPPASLTKLMTAYIATLEIRNGKIGEQDMVTVSEKAWRTGGSRMFIQVNTQVSVSDLLHGIRRNGNIAETETLLVRGKSRTIRRIQSIHYLDRKDPEMQVHIL